jgi:hypothetical protein
MDLLMQSIPFKVVIAIDRVMRKQWALTGICYTCESVNFRVGRLAYAQPTANPTRCTFRSFQWGGAQRWRRARGAWRGMTQRSITQGSMTQHSMTQHMMTH